MEQQVLISPPRPALIPARPRRSDSDVIAEAVKASLPAFMAYCERNDCETDGVAQDLTDLLHGSDTDGYHMARVLESKMHWAEDRELLPLCDELENALWDAERKIIREWIEAFHIKPRYAVGAQVKAKSIWREHGRIRHHAFDGEVVAIDAERGTYTIRISALGHVPYGSLGTNGVILTWEEVEGANG